MMSGQADERRAVRHPCQMEGTCRALLPDTEPLWSATVLDISRQGIALLLSRELDRGTGLVVTLRDVHGASHILEASVVFCRPHPTGKWWAGCEPADELTEEQVNGMVQHGSARPVAH
jgi:hypothetical protein